MEYMESKMQDQIEAAQIWAAEARAGMEPRETNGDLDAMFIASWERLSSDVNENAIDKGWWDEERNNGELIALMHGELSEALEAMRIDMDMPDNHVTDHTAVEVELADVVLRIMDFGAARGLNIGSAILAKNAYNKTRKHKHGGKKF